MRLLGLIISLLFYGCSLCSMEESAQVSAVSDIQSDDDGQKNLAAIRAMLLDQRNRTPPATDSSDKRNAESEASSWPPDWLSSYFSPKRLSREESDLPSGYVPSSSSSLPNRQAAPPGPTIKIPRTTTAPPRSFEAEPSPPVPPYTVPAPIGAAYPGSARCVPDLLGGQRCHAN